jgi:hypothetical protein
MVTKKYPYSLFKVFELYEKYGDVNRVIAEIDGNVETIKRNINFLNSVRRYDKYNKKVDVPSMQSDRFSHLENKYWKRKYNELLTQKAYEDRIVELFREALNKPSNFNFKPIPRKKEKTYYDVVLLLSDFHAGEEVSSDEILNLNEFNMDILKDRLEKIFKNTIELCETHNLFDANRINVWMLGDMVSGLIHEELLQGTSVADEVILTSEHLSTMLHDFAKEFKNVNVCGVVGNHGRFDKKPYNKKKYSNLDYILYKHVEAKCYDIQNISFNLPKCPYIIESIFDYNFFISHGDTYTKSAMYPQSGVKRTSDNISNTLSYTQNKYIHYYCLGHFHNINQFERAGGKIIMNGSLIGYNEYAFNKNFSFSEPKQVAFIVNEKFGVNGIFDVNVV